MISLQIVLGLLILFYTNIGFSTATSKYNYVQFNKNKQRWIGVLLFRLETGKYKKITTSYSVDEVATAKALNQICLSHGMAPKNPEINGVPIPSRKPKLYGSVYYVKKTGKWEVYFCFNGKRTHGGRFQNIINAQRSVNRLCEENNLPQRYPEVGTVVEQEKLQGILWTERNNSWLARFWNGEKEIYGGYYPTALEAAKAVNNICEENKVPHKNANIGINPNRIKPQRYKKAWYAGKGFSKVNGKYVVKIIKNGEQIYGGDFEDILDAAKRANELCDKNEMPHKNKALTYADDTHKEIEIEFDENLHENLTKRKRKRKSKFQKKYFFTDLLSKGTNFELVSN